MNAERAAATHTIATAGERREALFLKPDSDTELLAIGSEIDRANLSLERLDHVQPALEHRLGEIKFYERGDRWEAYRDAVADRLAEFTGAEADYHRVFEKWASIYDEVTAEWPDAADILPRLPRMEHLPDFAGQLDVFRKRVIVLARPAPPTISSMQDFIDAARATGSVHELCPLDWRAEVERACSPQVAVKLVAGFMDSHGATHDKGAVLQLDYEEATKHVASGRAIYLDAA